MGEAEELHLGPQALMLVALVVALFAVLGLKLLHQNSLHFTGSKYSWILAALQFRVDP